MLVYQIVKCLKAYLMFVYEKWVLSFGTCVIKHHSHKLYPVFIYCNII